MTGLEVRALLTNPTVRSRDEVDRSHLRAHATRLGKQQRSGVTEQVGSDNREWTPHPRRSR